MSTATEETARRRTFAIISHPDAGKTTITEKFLLLGNAIQLAGTVKARKSSRHATSDWMQMEKDRGISVTTSVMQFPYRDRMINLLDTPGHEDFSEDTYRTLTAVDSAVMVIDAARGVEPRTLKLLEVCRLRDTPIMTFINKLDRDTRDPVELLDEIEDVLAIDCAPVTWPIGMGRGFRGIYHLREDAVFLYRSGQGDRVVAPERIDGLMSPEVGVALGEDADALREEVALVRGASHAFDLRSFREGHLTPVYFGTALGNFGVRELLDDFVEIAPAPRPRPTATREVTPCEGRFSGFVFKIQANMDPRHRDRIAFLRICSGHYQHGMKLKHVRLGKDVKIADAVTFMAGERTQTQDAWPGDIIGLHNHGNIQIGDTFTVGEDLKFTGIPNFAPELFRRVRVRDPLKSKQLEKGLAQLSEEGAMQVFRPLGRNELIVGAVGVLQFDVVTYRLKDEYKADCIYDESRIYSARWVDSDDPKAMEEFKRKVADHLAVDAGGHLAYLAPSRVNLELVQERFPDIRFRATREH